MNDSSDPAARNDPSSSTQHEPDEWRLWRPFFLGLGGLVFVLVVISVSL